MRSLRASPARCRAVWNLRSTKRERRIFVPTAAPARPLRTSVAIALLQAPVMQNRTRFAADRRFDVLCLGRLAVDFYAQQIGARLEDATSFSKYLGGSSANTAFGCARLGLRTGMISRIGDDGLGHFLVETLQKEGCDTSHVSVDPHRLTAAVVLAIKDRDTFPLIFLRENCADMAIAEDDVAEDYLARSRALLITGTHFSTPHVDRVSHLALDAGHMGEGQCTQCHSMENRTITPSAAMPTLAYASSTSVCGQPLTATAPTTSRGVDCSSQTHTPPPSVVTLGSAQSASSILLLTCQSATVEVSRLNFAALYALTWAIRREFQLAPSMRTNLMRSPR